MKAILYAKQSIGQKSTIVANSMRSCLINAAMKYLRRMMYWLFLPSLLADGIKFIVVSIHYIYVRSSCLCWGNKEEEDCIYAIRFTF